MFYNTLTANYEYFRRILQNLHLRIEIKLSEKPLMPGGTFFPFLGSKLNFSCSGKKETRDRLSISEVIESERCAYLNA